MPKKRKLLARTLYTYVEPLNNIWIRRAYKKKGYKSYSAYLNHLITRDRVSAEKRAELSRDKGTPRKSA